MSSFLIGMTGGLYSLNEGRDAAPHLILPGLQPTALAVDPSEPTRIYCSTYNRGLWRSDDAGASWKPAGTPQDYYGAPVDGAIGPRETTFVSVSPRPNPQGRHTVWVGTEMSALYRSDDLGENFRRVTSFDTQRSRSGWSFPPRPNTHHVRWLAHGHEEELYVSIEFGALLRSFDAGETFGDRLSDSPLDTHVLLTHPAAPGRLYAALGDGLMARGRSYAESFDRGETWRYDGTGFGDMVYLYGMAINPADPEDIRVAGAAGPRAAHSANGPSSIFRRSSGQWIKDADGFPGDHSLVPVLGTDPARPGRWFALSNQGLFEQVPGADSWSRLVMHDEWSTMHALCLLVTDPQ